MTTKKKTAKKVAKKKAAKKKAPAKKPGSNPKPPKAAKPKPPPNPPAKPKAFNPNSCSAEQLGEVLGLTRQAVNRLFKARTIPNNGKRGKYDIFTAVPQYIQSIKTSGAAEAGERLKIQQERKLKLQNDEAAGLLVKVEDAAQALNEAVAAYLSSHKSIPRRVAAKLSALDDPAAIREILEDESSNARNEIIGRVKLFFKSRNRKDLADSITGDAEHVKAPAAKSGTVGKRK